jgi:hypothetical protein
MSNINNDNDPFGLHAMLADPNFSVLGPTLTSSKTTAVQDRADIERKLGITSKPRLNDQTTMDTKPSAKERYMALLREGKINKTYYP